MSRMRFRFGVISCLGTADEALGLLSEHLSGQSASVLALVNHDHATDDDVGDARGVLVGVSEGRPIGDSLGVE
jgi:hypothetical protein